MGKCGEIKGKKQKSFNITVFIDVPEYPSSGFFTNNANDFKIIASPLLKNSISQNLVANSNQEFGTSNTNLRYKKHKLGKFKSSPSYYDIGKYEIYYDIPNAASLYFSYNVEMKKNNLLSKTNFKYYPSNNDLHISILYNNPYIEITFNSELNGKSFYLIFCDDTRLNIGFQDENTLNTNVNLSGIKSYNETHNSTTGLYCKGSLYLSTISSYIQVTSNNSTISFNISNYANPQTLNYFNVQLKFKDEGNNPQFSESNTHVKPTLLTEDVVFLQTTFPSP
jgi:hypothetical protein